MSSNQINPYFAYVYPFYGYPIHLPFQKTIQASTSTNICFPNSDPPESQPISIRQRVNSRQSRLKLEKEGYIEDEVLKRRSLRKQKAIKKREREDNFARKKQKKDRNIPSNIFKYFINYLYYHPNLQQILPYNAHKQIDLPLLINNLKQHITETQSYIRPAIIQKLCNHSILTPQESLCFRMVLKRFLLLDFPTLISPMHKLKKRQRKELINYGRRLFEQLRERTFE